MVGYARCESTEPVQVQVLRRGLDRAEAAVGPVLVLRGRLNPAADGPQLRSEEL